MCVSDLTERLESSSKSTLIRSVLPPGFMLHVAQVPAVYVLPPSVENVMDPIHPLVFVPCTRTPLIWL